MHSQIHRALACTALCATLAFACAPLRANEPAERTVPIRAELGFERITLPGDEKLGLVGSSVLFPIAERWWAGLAVYGAATGQRGGLFVGGAELKREWELPWGWDLGTGLYAGGGGGAAAPVGGGLMWRGALTLSRDLGPVRAGLTWSHVRFPSGDIQSSQWGLLLSWQRPFRYFDADAAGQRQPAGEATGLGFRRMAGTVSTYSLRGGDSRRIGLAGGRVEWAAASQGLFTGIEASAAASGEAAGYMEILGSAGWRIAPWTALPQLTLDVRGSLGLGGGGAVPTEGGGIAKLMAGASFDWGRGWRSGIEGGVLHGVGSSLRANVAQLWVAMDLEPPSDSPGGGTITRNEWSVTVQRQARAQRNDGSTRGLDTIGMKLNRYVDDHIYLSAQAHSAFSGGAGAYSIGLIGAGASTRPPGAWRYGGEVLLGAAGGGGVASGGGAIAQVLAWAGLPVSRESELRAGVGAVKSLRGGELRSPVLELTWTRSLGLGGY
ncbi:MAG TPA: hypothetical protein VFO28_08335 [Burkholderiaceae bacterium]|nr:hypothetical protein [Burkholderiaceae bacterium]